MNCTFCESECCLKELIYYSRGNFLSPVDMPTHFKITFVVNNTGADRFIKLTSYNNGTPVSEMNCIGNVVRYFNQIQRNEFNTPEITLLFRKLERACKFEGFIDMHKIFFEEWGMEK